MSERMFRSARTRKVLRKMFGGMKPSEMWDLAKDEQLKHSDIPQWIEQMIRQECTILMSRFEHYKDKYIAKYGHIGSCIEKMVRYPSIWENWDDQETFPWREEKSIKYYMDAYIRDQRQ